MFQDFNMENQIVVVDEKIGSNTAQETIETTISFWEPAMAIKDLENQVINYTSKVQKEAVLISGTLFHQVYYVDENHFDKRKAEENYFEVSVNIPGAFPGMKVMTQIQIHEWEGNELESGMAAQIRVKMYFKVTVLNQKELEILINNSKTDKDYRDIKIEREKIIIDNLFHEGNYNKNYSFSSELAEKVEHIDRIAAHLNQIQTEKKEDTLIINGTIIGNIYYHNENGQLSKYQDQFPCNASINIPGLKPFYKVTVIPEVIVYHYQLNQQGHVNIEQEILVFFKVVIKDIFELEVLTQVSAPGIKVHKNTIKAIRKIGTVELSDLVTSKIELEETAEEIYQFITYLCHSIPQIENGKIMLGSEIKIKILFREENSLHVQHDNFSFNLKGVLTGAKKQHWTRINQFIVEESSCNLTNNYDLELGITPKVIIEVLENFQKEIISDTSEVNIPKETPSKVYIVQEKDTIEKISWRFQISVEDLLNVNPEIVDNSELATGQKIRVPVK